MHGIALRHIQVRNASQSVAASLDAQDDTRLRGHLQTVQNVMKMVKHLFEGAPDKEMKQDIVEKVEENRKLIEKVDELLERYKGNDDMAVMIVKIISCFNSISNNMDEEKVRLWIQDFSGRFIEAARPDKAKGSQ